MALDKERTLYINCDLPEAESSLSDPVAFYQSCDKPMIVFDEIHQLNDPSRLLKIGADMFPKLKILATGSSTLAATKKFSDTLTGRKRVVHLLPVLFDELESFDSVSLATRLYHGGLPAALLASHRSPALYREWVDSFFARDVQRLFGFRDLNRFSTFFEYILKLSGGQLELMKAATAIGISRPTLDSHLNALETMHAATIVRPFHNGGLSEITKMPKVFAFDTGFVCWARGWNPPRPDELGLLWEHIVLEHLQAHFPDETIRYWRDKQGHEIDFVVHTGRDEVDTIECKWNADSFDSGNLSIFRKAYPKGRNFLICPNVQLPRRKKFGDHEVLICTPKGLSTHGTV